MEIVLINIIAFLASLLTLFSGFGLGTILMPVVAIFLPVPTAIAITALVHLLNNFFKVLLLWRNINKRFLVVFGIPALIAAIPGALLLDIIAGYQELATYNLADHQFTILPVKLVAGILLLIFATAEWIPFLKILSSSKRSIIAGGVLSGFFGGLSGHQGAFRSAFLIKANLDKKAFVATNSAIACLVDISRLVIYGLTFSMQDLSAESSLVTTAAISAFLGVFLGTRLLKKATISALQKLVAFMLYVLGALLIAGII